MRTLTKVDMCMMADFRESNVLVNVWVLILLIFYAFELRTLDCVVSNRKSNPCRQGSCSHPPQNHLLRQVRMVLLLLFPLEAGRARLHERCQHVGACNNLEINLQIA